MAVSQKGKRRITVGDTVYLWHVFEDWDQSFFSGVQTTVASKDRRLFVRYGLQQPDAKRNAVVARGLGTRTSRIPCPRFEGDDGILTPQGVRQLIEWSLAQDVEKAGG